jgi:hypothetical protein
MALNEIEIEAFEATAKRLTREVDISFFIETYAANPNLAGGQLTDLLASLPVAPASKSQTKVDAFVGLALLSHTQEQIAVILGDDMYMQELLDEHHASDVDITDSLSPDTPTQKQQDRDIQKSARGSDSTSDIDRDIRHESTKNDDAVHDSFQNALSGNAPKEKRSFDFSRFDPFTTFRESTRALVERIMHAALSRNRLQPLFENGYTTEDDVDALCRSLRFMVSKLRFDEGDPDKDDDDEDAGEDWKH